MTSVIYAQYGDVGEQKPRYGGSTFTLHRQVHQIQAVAGGETGIIQYKGRSVAVYRRPGGHWDTSRSVLAPIKITYLH